MRARCSPPPPPTIESLWQRDPHQLGAKPENRSQQLDDEKGGTSISSTGQGIWNSVGCMTLDGNYPLFLSLCVSPFFTNFKRDLKFKKGLDFIPSFSKEKKQIKEKKQKHSRILCQCLCVCVCVCCAADCDFSVWVCVITAGSARREKQLVPHLTSALSSQLGGMLIAVTQPTSPRRVRRVTIDKDQPASQTKCTHTK